MLSPRIMSAVRATLWNSLLTARDAEPEPLQALNADLDRRLLKADFGGVHRAARAPAFNRYGLQLQTLLKGRYLETAGARCRILFGEERWAAADAGRGTDSYFQADIELAATDRVLRRAHVDIAFDDHELWLRAESHAGVCLRIAHRHSTSHALALLNDYARCQGIRAPTPFRDRVSPAGCVNRLTTPRWWYRAMRHTYGRRAEDALRGQGLVHAEASLYVSPSALHSRLNRRLATMELLGDATATNDQGQSFSLGELWERSVSNPANRRAELMVRVRGTETYARAQGHIGQFLVVTTPSRFHCVSSSGARNPSYCGESVRDAQAWLNRRWRQLRAALERKGFPFYGLRTVEPHHDGTPHWNVLIFAPADATEAIRQEFERYFLLSDSPHEPGARTRRVRCKSIDPAKGDATSYIAKYISKAIDGYGVGADLEDGKHHRDTRDTCIRVEAWASIHGIRQFQFFGGPPAAVWRQLRRLGRTSLGVIESARLAAEEPSWSAYMEAQGGARPPLSGWAVRLHKCYVAEPGLYGDPLGMQVTGVESDGLVEITRAGEWRIEWPISRPWCGFFSPLESCQ